MGTAPGVGMKTMNYETAQWGRSALDGEDLDPATLERRRRRKRRIIIAGLIALVVVIGVAFALSRGAKPAAADKSADAAPRITVVVPGRQQIDNTISATGSLAARHDMPVGVSGEGGMVDRVVADAGQWVGAGQTLAVIERSVQTEEARQLAASVDVARADAALAQSELNRSQQLVSRGFVSKADIERLTATRDSAAARVRVAQANLAESRARLGRLDVRSPTAGLVLQRMVEPGQIVSSGSGALFRVADRGEMELRAHLTQNDLNHVRVGAPATVTPVGSSQSFAGTVWQVAPIVDPQTRQGDVRISVAFNPALRPGGFASADINTGKVDAPMLPESAVQSDDKGNFVYIVNNDNKVERRNIKVGEVSDSGVAIVAGLEGNERVVETAGAFLNAGQKVQPVRASAQP